MDNLFENMSIKRAYFTLALPVVLSMAVTLVYNLVDTFFVSKTGNPNLVAGVSQGAPIFTLMIALGDIFGLGGSSLISRLFGEHKDKIARNVSGYCFYYSIACGLIVTLLLFVFQTPILHLLGASPATWKYAREYYLVIAGGSTFIIFSLSPNNILRTEGLAIQSMIGSMAGTIINIFLNPIFIFTCGLGAAGSALATVTSSVIADVILVYYLRTKSKKLTTSIHETKISGRLQLQIYAIGIPASITNIMVSFATALTNRYLISYGASSVAAMGIAMKANSIIVMIMVGFAFGAQPLIGYAYGAKNQKRFYETIHFDLFVISALNIVLTIVLLIFAPNVIRLFMSDPTIVHEGGLMLRWLSLTTTLAGIILVFTTAFQSMGKAAPAFWLSFSRQGLIFGFSIAILAHFFGYTGIIAAQACSDVLTLILSLIFYKIYEPHFNQK
ncbi:MATE family efflux transporter [Limosilactobacillus frumenti]|uniref:MATE family efflux transporter n=1 Tax=Limosilactobacillus frumenti TaxID=104955 RepID=UPI00124B681B|nr:MATE family efflux transporter [Limosilactobacillus frumenti]MBA2913554.1 MATE family efflux transporter [Limosilactobacillus frumenti]QFG73211.1 MATE family efflux transporter [Limosilactobacillus frumenti]